MRLKKLISIVFIPLVLLLSSLSCSQGAKKDFYDRSGPWREFTSGSEYKRTTIRANRYGANYDGNKPAGQVPPKQYSPSVTTEKKITLPGNVDDKELKDLQNMLQSAEGNTKVQSGKTWKKIIHIGKNGDNKTVITIRTEPVEKESKDD